jgi:hypothetical protein
MSNDPKPEHRISNLEKEFMQLGSRIEEAASDSAEEFKAVRQDIKGLEEGMMSSFKELGGYFELTEKAMATKDDISRLEARFDKVEGDITALKTDHGAKLDLILQLLQQKSGE